MHIHLNVRIRVKHIMRLTPDSRAPAKADPCVGCNPCPCSGVVGGVVVVVVVAVVVVVVVVVAGNSGDRTTVVWKTGAGTSGVPVASFGGRGLTARVYPRRTEVGRAVWTYTVYQPVMVNLGLV